MTRKKVTANVERKNFFVELDEFGGKQCWWKVMPAFKYRSEGDLVLYGDRFYLVDYKGETFLHTSRDKADDIFERLHEEYVHSTYEVNACGDAAIATRWNFIPFRANEKELAQGSGKRSLLGGDIVYFYHTEAEAILRTIPETKPVKEGLIQLHVCSTGVVRTLDTSDMPFSSHALWKLEAQESKLHFPVQCVAGKSHPIFPFFVPNYFFEARWNGEIVESVQRAAGLHQAKKSYRLKHIATEQYLALAPLVIWRL